MSCPLPPKSGRASFSSATLFLEIPSNATSKTWAGIRKWCARFSPQRPLEEPSPTRRWRGPVDLIGLLRFNFRPAFPSLTTTSRPPRHAAMKLCAVERVMSVRAIGPSNLPYFGIRRINFNDRWNGATRMKTHGENAFRLDRLGAQLRANRFCNRLPSRCYGWLRSSTLSVVCNAAQQWNEIASNLWSAPCNRRFYVCYKIRSIYVRTSPEFLQVWLYLFFFFPLRLHERQKRRTLYPSYMYRNIKMWLV